MQLFWGKCLGDNWCSFMHLKLEDQVFENAYGIYIIWSGAQTIKVGSGLIREEISKDRIDPRITIYPDSTLKVSWCKIDYESNYIKGIQKYFIEKLNPAIRLNILDVEPVEANFPWK